MPGEGITVVASHEIAGGCDKLNQKLVPLAPIGGAVVMRLRLTARSSCRPRPGTTRRRRQNGIRRPAGHRLRRRLPKHDLVSAALPPICPIFIFVFLRTRGPRERKASKHVPPHPHVSPRRAEPLVRSLGVPRSESPCYSRSCRRPGALQQHENASTPTSTQRSRANSARIGGIRNRFNGVFIMLHDAATAHSWAASVRRRASARKRAYARGAAVASNSIVTPKGRHLEPRDKVSSPDSPFIPGGNGTKLPRIGSNPSIRAQRFGDFDSAKGRGNGCWNALGGPSRKQQC
jgi:hypothetical protein